jgi:hypothetical protein
MKSVVTVWEAVVEIYLVYLPIKAAKSLFMDACDSMQLILLKMQEQKLLTPC